MEISKDMSLRKFVETFFPEFKLTELEYTILDKIKDDDRIYCHPFRGYVILPNGR
jgi:hypothetical protein